ncbi:MAG: TetR family transcriptional regulator [Thermoactinospora sp.]|nr:TetR family transcriptional regulator [Thermoactinospora sp.]
METVGRRERKKQATRSAVRQAALRLALRHGVEGVTVEQIASEADIALRTFFNYFSSKEEAVVASAAAGAEALIGAFRARPRSESVLRALREAVLAVIDDADGHDGADDRAGSHDYVAAIRLIHRTPALMPHQLAVLAAQEKALADAIAERLPPGDPRGAGIYPALCAATALTALRVVLGRWLAHADGERTPPTALLGQEIDQAIAALAAGMDRPGTPARG